MNIFEQAARTRLRFASVRGLLTTEDLFSLPLVSKSDFDLNTVAKQVHAELKAAGEENFVETVANPERTRPELSMEIVKHVIAAKQAENKAKLEAAGRAAEKAKLLALLDKKQDAALEGLSEEDIRKKIAELG